MIQDSSLSSFSREFISHTIPEWKNLYVDYPTIRRKIRLADEAVSLNCDHEKKRKILLEVTKFDIPGEIEKVNTFFRRTEEKYTQRHGQLREQFEKWNVLQASERRKTVIKVKLIRAYQEHNKAINYLKNYKELNHTAFLRLFHKLELTGADTMDHAHKTLIESQYFWSSGLLEFMHKDTEMMFKMYFYENPKTAIEKLNTLRDEFARVTYIWRSGVLFGISFLWTIMNIVYYFYSYVNMSIPYGSTSITMFKVAIFPIVLLVLNAFDLFIFNANYINYVFIFQLDPTRRISKYIFLEMSCLVYCVWQFHFLLYMLLATFGYDLAWIVPIVMYGVFLIWMIMPFNILYRPARYWLIDVLFRLLFAPFVPVAFKDFFIGDQLTSLGDFLFGIQFVVCIWPISYDPTFWGYCKNYTSLGLPILSLWPNLARFLQCLRRYNDDPTKWHPHLVNGGKYLSSILAILFQYIDVRIVANGKPYASWNWARTVWVVINIISTFWKLGYDILMDWGLCSFVFCKKDAKYPLLKKQLIFHPVWYGM